MATYREFFFYQTWKCLIQNTIKATANYWQLPVLSPLTDNEPSAQQPNRNADHSGDAYHYKNRHVL